MKRTLVSVILFLIVVSAVIVGAVMKKNNNNSDLTKVKVAEVAHSIFYAPQYAAISNGYFEEEGLDNIKIYINIILTNPEEIKRLAEHIHKTYPELKTAMYSGAPKAWKILWESKVLDYYKIGPWIKSKGPLDSPTTNQRLYKLTDAGYIDITHRFIEKKEKTLLL